MRRWPQSSHPSMCPPSSTGRCRSMAGIHLSWARLIFPACLAPPGGPGARPFSMADITLSWARLICPACAARQAGPAARKTSATSSGGRIAYSAARALSLHQQLEVLERTGYRADRLRRDTGIKRRRVELGMSQKDLNNPDVDVLLQKMRGEA